VIDSSAFRERLIDLEAVPWSRRGSYMSLSMNTESRDHPGREHPIDPGLYLCDVGGYRLWRWNGVFRIVGLCDGEPAPLTVIEAKPTFLRLAAGRSPGMALTLCAFAQSRLACDSCKA
jgi:hypothetical protein